MAEIEARIKARTQPAYEMKPTTATYNLGDNQNGQAIQLCFSGQSVFIKQEAASQRDYSSEITLSRKQFDAICASKPSPDLQ